MFSTPTPCTHMCTKHCCPLLVFAATHFCLLQLAVISHKVAEEAGLLSESISDAEKLRLAMVLAGIKRGLQKLPNGFDVGSTNVAVLDNDFTKFKQETEYKLSSLSIKQFLLRPEEAQIFELSPSDVHGNRRIKLNLPALVHKPSKELQSLMPNIRWDASSSKAAAAAQSNDEAVEDLEVIKTSTAVGMTMAARSLLNPEPGVVCTYMKRSHLALRPA